ncbi:MAG TPA: HAD-IIA family hydrolase [Vitreimonas sp.]|nr:HAD-IIA family hydrolase [Vitreimonas sp.]
MSTGVLPIRLYAGYVFDLDGTLYLGEDLLPGARETVATLREQGSRVAFLTNKPLELPAAYAAKLTELGIPARPDDVVSSTDALLRYLRLHAPGARIFPVAEPLVADLLEADGHTITDDPSRIQIVVVSFDRTFDYQKLLVAYRAVRLGARLIATNPDPYCPTPDGGLPDCAAILAAIETASGGRAEAVVGKPSGHMAEAVLARLGLPAGETLLVGDRLLTDVRMAQVAGMSSALVLSGATTRADVDASPVQPDFVISSVADLVPAALEAIPATQPPDRSRT